MSKPKRALAVLLFTSAIPLGVGRVEPAAASTGKITATPDPITVAEGEQATIAVHLTQPLIFPNVDDPRTSTITFTSDDPSRVADAIVISRRTMRVARQSIWAGLGLSSVAMGFAAFGFIPPTAGAILQELIDLAVILNALRASAD